MDEKMATSSSWHKGTVGMSYLANSFHFNFHSSDISDIMNGATICIMDWNFLQDKVTHTVKTAHLWTRETSSPYCTSVLLQ